MRRTCAMLPVLLTLGAAAWAQIPPGDTTPAHVVQRFVDGWNARQLDSMMATLATEAVFAELPSAVPFALGRDSIRAIYAAEMTKASPITVQVDQRTARGAFVLDHELFFDARGTAKGQSTWLYFVTGGLIRRGWELIQPMAPAP